MYDYHFINIYNSQINPSTVHCSNADLVRHYARYLFEKVLSVYKFENLPPEWPVNYFLYCLFGYGFITVFNTEEYGLIANECSLSGYDIYYQPTQALVANPILGSRRLNIGEDCELIKVQPDYNSIMDIVSLYADLMALCTETAGINLLNSKMSYVFFAENKAAAESFKKLYDKIASGEPAAVTDKLLLGEDGNETWKIFSQNVGQNYITDRILTDMRTIENMFNTDVGIPNANTMKRERLISDEVNANNVDTQSKTMLWLETIRDGVDKVNSMFNTDITVKYRFEEVQDDQNISEPVGAV